MGKHRSGHDVNELPRANSVLAVCAHPDDESFGLGATLAAFTAAGASTAVLCFTRGEATTLGGSGPDADISELGGLRATELADAATELGIHHLELFDYPDGSLAEQPLDRLAKHVCQVADRVGADLIVVFDEGGITGHSDHSRATEAALAFARDSRLPVLAWALPETVATSLNAQFGTEFIGRETGELDLEVHVNRARQHKAIARHMSQATDNPVLWRRLELQADRETFRWLLAPSRHSPICSTNGPSPLSDDGDHWEG